MDYYPDGSSHSLHDRLDVVVRMLDAASALTTAAAHPMLQPSVFGYTMGRKYARVYYDMSNGQRMVAFFVDQNGDVWKADGWAGPALNFVRGNINSRDGRWAITGGKFGPNGYFYPGF